MLPAIACVLLAGIAVVVQKSTELVCMRRIEHRVLVLGALLCQVTGSNGLCCCDTPQACRPECVCLRPLWTLLSAVQSNRTHFLQLLKLPNSRAKAEGAGGAVAHLTSQARSLLQRSLLGLPVSVML